MKIILDTNVLIAALIARGTCHELLEHCAVRHDLYTSDFILNELQEKLIEKFDYSPELAAEAVGVVRSPTPRSLKELFAAIPMTTTSSPRQLPAVAIALSPTTRMYLC